MKRVDIQGLRAVAVLLVVAFHYFPARLPGGYVGVDVFLVISGFLITTHLLDVRPKSARDVVRFWAKRIRRLLPASLLVIAVTVVAGLLILPASRFTDLGRDAVASALYFVNWTLASSSVDYFGSAASPSPLQHYWSLSVEEQFYLIWPILLVVVFSVIARFGPVRQRWMLVAALSVFVSLSLVVSVIWTILQPSFAYFATPTRLWELGAGGLLAVVAHGRRSSMPDGIRAALAWVGLALIVVSALVYSTATPFPGFFAVLPVAGAVLFLAASSSKGVVSPSTLLGWRPVQHLGDVSYSLYLWHWPLIVLVPIVFGELSTLWKLALVLLAMGLATATKVLVEDPPRRSVALSRSLPRTFAAALVATTLVVGISLVPIAQVAQLAQASADEARESAVQNAGCFGAAALAHDECDVSGSGIVPSPAVAIDDKSDAYKDECIAVAPFPAVTTCAYGDPMSSVRIALVGNSHAAQWLPTLQEIVDERGYELTTFIASRCRPTTIDIIFTTEAETQGCRAWGEEVVDATSTGDFDLIVFANASVAAVEVGPPESAFQHEIDGYLGPLAAWAEADQRVLVLRDTPIPNVDIPACVGANLDSPTTCDGDRETWLLPDPAVAATAAINSPLVTSLDLSEYFCEATNCPAVVGGVLVYFDNLHVTATYATTLAPYLGRGVDAALRG